MAAVAEQEPEIAIKKEVEDNFETTETTESPTNVSNSTDNGSQKHTKVWGEDETRSLIELHKSCIQKFKDGNYSKRQLLEDIAQELNLIGYDATTEHVRNKIKYLRTRYNAVIDYNLKHVEKKTIPFQNELAELYSMDYFDDQDSVLHTMNGSGSNGVIHSKRSRKRSKYPTLTSLNKPKKRGTLKVKYVKKKNTKTTQMLFQCGLCMNKFKSSNDLHDHVCKRKLKRKLSAPNSLTGGFQWNNLVSTKFLDLLKEYQDSSKNSNFRKGHIWENMSALMRRLGHKITPKELEKKWTSLSSTFIQTITYNKNHKDKRKCAFYLRLMDLYSHPSSFGCFQIKSGSVKRTVEVSPFSYSQTPQNSSNIIHLTNHSVIKDDRTKQSSVSDIITWLDTTWKEFKEMERAKQERENQRHNELMEMLSYLVDSKDHH